MAKDSGAECLAVACPMCQINLDMRQDDIFKATGHRYDMPVIYVSQLIGSCLGIPEDALGLNKLIVSPKEAMSLPPPRCGSSRWGIFSIAWKS